MIENESSLPSETVQIADPESIIPSIITSPEQQKSTQLNLTLVERHNPSRKTAREIPPPPRWLGRSAYWFRLGFAVAVLISSLFSLTACGVSAKEVQWQPASKYFEPSLLEQIVTENSSLNPSQEVVDKMQVHQLAKQPRLTLVNFDNTDLCGQLGCLYVIYLESQGKVSKVFNRYLRPELPKDISLIELSERTQNNLPCLILNQLSNNNLTKLTLCYNGSEYQSFDLNVLKIKSENSPP